MKSRPFAALVLSAATVAATVLSGTARASDTGPSLDYDGPVAGVPDLLLGHHFKPGVEYIWSTGLGSFATATAVADGGGGIENTLTLPGDAKTKATYIVSVAAASAPSKPVASEKLYVQPPYIDAYLPNPWTIYSYVVYPSSERVDLALSHPLPGFPRSLSGGQGTPSVPLELGAHPEPLTVRAVGQTYHRTSAVSVTLAGASVSAPYDFGYERAEDEAILATANPGYTVQIGGEDQLQVINWHHGAGAEYPVWSTAAVPPGTLSMRLVLQTDGNLVLRSGEQAYWNSRTTGTGPHNRLALQSDGNLVLRDAVGNALWSSKTGRIDASQLLAGRTLYAGAQLIAGRYNAHLTAAGRLGVVGVRSWQSPAAGENSTLTLQPDGNLVLRSAAGKAVWTSGTAGTKATRLIMQPDGNLVLRTARGAGVWQSHTA